MPNDNERPTDTDNKRRRFLMQGATALTALAIGGAAGCQVQQQQKVSKAEAAYQPRPNGTQACGNCANFIAPDGCRVVQGPVAANGWSRYWRARSA
jgi:hypothetical protein